MTRRITRIAVPASGYCERSPICVSLLWVFGHQGRAKAAAAKCQSDPRQRSRPAWGGVRLRITASPVHSVGSRPVRPSRHKLQKRNYMSEDKAGNNQNSSSQNQKPANRRRRRRPRRRRKANPNSTPIEVQGFLSRKERGPALLVQPGNNFVSDRSCPSTEFCSNTGALIVL